jgi:hypothetical protein
VVTNRAVPQVGLYLTAELRPSAFGHGPMRRPFYVCGLFYDRLSEFRAISSLAGIISQNANILNVFRNCKNLLSGEQSLKLGDRTKKTLKMCKSYSEITRMVAREDTVTLSISYLIYLTAVFLAEPPSFVICTFLSY